MRRPAMLALATAILCACTQTEKFWDKEVVGVYAPGHMRDKEKARLGESLNFFLGKSKDERIRIIGTPNSCARLDTGEEACEWMPKASSAREQHVTYVFGTDNIARAWSYSGPLGQFTNADYLQASSRPVSASQPAQAQGTKKGWFHPTKSVGEHSPEFAQDYFECQNKLAHDPKAQSSLAIYVEYQIESCLREKGWVEK